jgi:hypothetical protein
VCFSEASTNFSYQLPTDNQNISIYPNPSPDGNFFIETLFNLSNTVITVYTLKGQQVYQTTATLLDGRQQLSLSMLPPGPYIIAVQSGDTKVAKRVQISQ